MDNIEEGFDIYSLLNLLGEVIDNVRFALKKLRADPEYINCYTFYKKNTGKIEVNINGDIQLVFFRIQPKCWFLTDITKTKFIANVPRETQQEKISGLIEGIPGFIDEMDHIEKMKKTKIKLTPETVTKVRDFSTLLAVLIAMIILIFFKYELVPRDDGAYDYKPYIPPQ